MTQPPSKVSHCFSHHPKLVVSYELERKSILKITRTVWYFTCSPVQHPHRYWHWIYKLFQKMCQQCSWCVDVYNVSTHRRVVLSYEYISKPVWMYNRQGKHLWMFGGTAAVLFSVSERSIFTTDCFPVLTWSLHMLMTAGLNGSHLLISVDVCEVLAKIVTHCCCKMSSITPAARHKNVPPSQDDNSLILRTVVSLIWRFDELLLTHRRLCCLTQIMIR